MVTKVELPFRNFSASKNGHREDHQNVLEISLQSKYISSKVYSLMY